MKIFTSVLFLLAFASIFAFALKEDEVICETSDGSPYMHHIQQLIDKLDASDEGNLCFSAQVGDKVGHCGPTMKEWSDGGGAAFQLCRTDFTHGKWDPRPKTCQNRRPGKILCGLCPAYQITGKDVAKILGYIAEECKSPHRAGGRFEMGWPWGGEVRLIRMPG